MYKRRKRFEEAHTRGGHGTKRRNKSKSGRCLDTYGVSVALVVRFSRRKKVGIRSIFLVVGKRNGSMGIKRGWEGLEGIGKGN